MNQTDESAKGIRQPAGTVLVVIGGGTSDDSDFDIFDQNTVIKAWAAKTAFKALGLGHKGTGGTLLDFISDYVVSTPTSVAAS